MFRRFFEFVKMTDNNNIKSVDEFLKVYDGTTFLNGLYRLHRTEDVKKWNAIIHEAFPNLPAEIAVFGYDWLGRNFAVDVVKDAVLICEPGTGEVMNTGVNFVDFHNSEIVEYHDACLASEFFDEWQKANDHYVLRHEQCVGYKVPLFLNGNDELDNLEVSDMEVYWGIITPLMNI